MESNIFYAGGWKDISRVGIYTFEILEKVENGFLLECKTCSDHQPCNLIVKYKESKLLFDEMLNNPEQEHMFKPLVFYETEKPARADAAEVLIRSLKESIEKNNKRIERLEAENKNLHANILRARDFVENIQHD